MDKSDDQVALEARLLLLRMDKKASSGGYTQDALRRAWHSAVRGKRKGKGSETLTREE